MRIFFIANWYPNPSNPADGVFLKNTSTAISKYADVTVFYADAADVTAAIQQTETGPGNQKTYIVYYPAPRGAIRLLNLAIRSVRRIAYLKKMIDRELKQAAPDVLHFNIISPSILLAWYYKVRYHIPLVYSEHWDVPLRAKLGIQKRWLAWRLGMKIAGTLSDKVVVCSNAIRGSFLQYRLASVKKLVTIPNVVLETTVTGTGHIDRAGKKVLLHVSSLNDRQKNITGMLRAMAELATQRNDFELHILGAGPELQTHKSFAQQLGLLDSVVFFHGYVSDEEKIKWYGRSSAHILFSNFEGYSVVTAESIFFGRPVVVTDCGGPADFVTPQTGLMVKPGDINAFVKAIDFVLNHPGLYPEDDLKSYARATFSDEVVGKAHLRLYTELINAKPAK